MRALGWASIREVIAADDKDSVVTVHSEPGLKCQDFFRNRHSAEQKSGGSVKQFRNCTMDQDTKLWPFHRTSVLWLVAACRVDLPSAEEKGGTETPECKGREREQIKLKTPHFIKER